MNNKSILYLDEMENSYSRGIRFELQKIFDKVDCYFYNDIYITPIFYNRLHHKECQKQRDTNIKLFLDYIKQNKYDIILVKSPLDLPIYFFERLRTIFKNVPIINYNWKSVQESNFLPYCKCFSKVYSFDRWDCQKYNLNYYPLFYLRDFENIGITKKKVFDISHIGSAYNSGRLEFINKAVTKFKPMNLKSYFYLYAKGRRKGFVTRIKYPRLSNCLFSQELSLNEVINKFSASEAMIDHPITIQTGLTMRTFETLSSGLNLYTTNVEIMKEPFFNSDNIKIIDKDLNNFTFENSNSITINKGWQASFSHYRIDNWVKYIISP
jgi:hypothetical protein